MEIGERIRYFRNKRGMTQKYLGTAVGFPEKSADVRLAQYESGTRSPKSELTKALAEVLDVSDDWLRVACTVKHPRLGSLKVDEERLVRLIDLRDVDGIATTGA